MLVLQHVSTCLFREEDEPSEVIISDGVKAVMIPWLFVDLFLDKMRSVLTIPILELVITYPLIFGYQEGQGTLIEEKAVPDSIKDGLEEALRDLPDFHNDRTTHSCPDSLETRSMCSATCWGSITSTTSFFCPKCKAPFPSYIRIDHVMICSTCKYSITDIDF